MGCRSTPHVCLVQVCIVDYVGFLVLMRPMHIRPALASFVSALGDYKLHSSFPSWLWL